MDLHCSLALSAVAHAPQALSVPQLQAGLADFGLPVDGMEKEALISLVLAGDRITSRSWSTPPAILATEIFSSTGISYKHEAETLLKAPYNILNTKY